MATPNPASFINSLLTSASAEQVCDWLHVCVKTLHEFWELELNINMLHYAILAGRYSESVKLAGLCVTQFKRYSEQCTGHLEILHARYEEALKLIMVKLLDEFNIEQEKATTDQVSKIADLLEIIPEKDRQSMLQNLSKKILETLPNGNFVDNYDQQLCWIFGIVENDSKYLLLEKYNVKKFIIDAYAEKLRDAILNVDPKNLKYRMYSETKKIEIKLEKYDRNFVELISIAFDPFCEMKIREAVESIKISDMDDVTDNVADGSNDETITIFKSAGQFINDFATMNKDLVALFHNVRNSELIRSLYEKKFREYCDRFATVLANKKYTVKDMQIIKAIIGTIKFLNSNAGTLKKKYQTFDPTCISKLKEGIYQSLYKKFVDECRRCIDNSLEKYMVSIFPGNIGNLIKKNNSNNTAMILDTSNDITSLVELLKLLNDIDTDIVMYLFPIIYKIYNDKISPDNLLAINSRPRVNSEIFNQILMDIAYIKNVFKISATMFYDLENKIKLMNSDIINDEMFVQNYIFLYKNHSKEYLSKFLKFKNLDSVKISKLVQLYTIACSK